MIPKEKIKIGVIGLGYVGLPLAIEFSKKYEVIGFDVNSKRIKQLISGKDNTNEVENDELKKSSMNFSYNESDLSHCNVFIVTVPTPINDDKEPNLSPIVEATKTVSKYVKKGSFIIYESTVYPGTTEEVCVPLLEEISKLKLNDDFFVGYSPERINPGDKVHTITKILKITSGSSKKAALFIDDLYGSIITAGTYKASSIKVAEAAKVIENTQRDVNIALINELSKIFNILDIDTSEVLRAAETKWNFIPFKPGLVGGHCIGVDPYYLTHKAQQVGYNPEIILAGRKINDGMSEYVAEKFIEALDKKNINVSKAKVLVMGLTFKENCPDLRNTKIIDIVSSLKLKGLDVKVSDPICSISEAKDLYGIDLIQDLGEETYDGLIFAVPHDNFTKMSIEDAKKICKSNHIIFDLKNILNSDQVDMRL